LAKKIYRRKLAPKQRMASPTPDIWQMPPYIVARFGGELTQVMLKAAQEYIIEKCLTEISKGFNKEITVEQSLS
jgi:hypothetical protein